LSSKAQMAHIAEIVLLIAAVVLLMGFLSGTKEMSPDAPETEFSFGVVGCCNTSFTSYPPVVSACKDSYFDSSICVQCFNFFSCDIDTNNKYEFTDITARTCYGPSSTSFTDTVSGSLYNLVCEGCFNVFNLVDTSTGNIKYIVNSRQYALGLLGAQSSVTIPLFVNLPADSNGNVVLSLSVPAGFEHNLDTGITINPPTYLKSKSRWNTFDLLFKRDISNSFSSDIKSSSSLYIESGKLVQQAYSGYREIFDPYNDFKTAPCNSDGICSDNEKFYCVPDNKWWEFFRDKAGSAYCYKDCKCLSTAGCSALSNLDNAFVIHDFDANTYDTSKYKTYDAYIDSSAGQMRVQYSSQKYAMFSITDNYPWLFSTYVNGQDAGDKKRYSGITFELKACTQSASYTCGPDSNWRCSNTDLGNISVSVIIENREYKYSKNVKETLDCSNLYLKDFGDTHFVSCIFSNFKYRAGALTSSFLSRAPFELRFTIDTAERPEGCFIVDNIVIDSNIMI